MENLNKMGLVELDTQKMDTIIGGSGGFLGGLAGGLLAAFIWECIDDWNANVEAFNQGQIDGYYS